MKNPEMLRNLFFVGILMLAACGEDSNKTQSPDAETADTSANITQHEEDLQSGVDSALVYLNELRKKAGMIEFQINSQLADSAANHANYVISNNTVGHDESSGLSGFTGNTVAERAAFSGYQGTQLVHENLTVHSEVIDGSQSIDDLFSAIYHRLTFLSFSLDEIGAGYQEQSGNNSYVYNLGNSNLDALCKGVSFDGTGQSFFQVCADDGFKIERSTYLASTDDVESQNPKVVMWPFADAVDIPPVFFEESPDPLPNHQVSGYPISVQFNPQFFSQPPQVTLFKLTDVANDSLPELITLMDKSSDPNESFDAYEYAIFPLQRLEWNHTYRADIEYIDAGNSETLSWTFTTRNPGDNFFRVTDDQVVTANSGDTFIIYVPPKNEHDIDSLYNISVPTTMAVAISHIDKNTLKITLSGQGSANLSFHSVNLTIKSD